MIKKANLESLMPTIYTKLKSLGEINDVVPISSIVSGLSKGDARAYVSNEDKNTDGIPDKIYIVYPKLNIDLQQDLSGVTTADIMAFPNVDSQKTHQVSNILAAITNVLNHEQDHLKGFKTHNNIDEFSPEHSAEHAGDEAAKLFINKYTSLDREENIGSNSMIEELKKLSTHLRGIKEDEFAEDLNRIIRNADDITGESIQIDADDSIAWLTSVDGEETSSLTTSNLLVTAGDKKELLPHKDLLNNFKVEDSIRKVNEAKKELDEAKKDSNNSGFRSSVSEKLRILNKAIEAANIVIKDVKRENENNKAFTASFKRHSDAAAAVEQADDQSFNLDSLFASSIMGSRNIK